MPRAAVIEEDEYEGEQCGHRRKERHPPLAVEVAQVHQPRAAAGRLGDVGALLGPVRVARGGAAGVGRSEGVGGGEALGLDLRRCRGDMGRCRGDAGEMWGENGERLGGERFGARS